ncbi:pyridoxamine 5'-phosphate oxidase family protein [Nonomuraea sp. NPDC050556]|uniref:pyridoxamine 5'-phosphate oxidase family protein n=1 Tax=Nonomuraea sp. NPDC050556 TaxID=3364369 RepID=UPI00378FBDBB
MTPLPGRPLAPSAYAFSDDPSRWLSWDDVEVRLGEARYYWLASASADGVPHATPVMGVWVDLALYVEGLETARWARNLAANPRVTAHLESAENVVIVDAVAEKPVMSGHEGIVGAWASKYGRPLPAAVLGDLFRLRPSVVRAWSSTSLKDGTRFTF